MTALDKADKAAGIGQPHDLSWVPTALQAYGGIPVETVAISGGVLVIAVFAVLFFKGRRKSPEETLIASNAAQSAEVIKLLGAALEDSARASRDLRESLDTLIARLSELTEATLATAERLARIEGRCSVCPNHVPDLGQ